MRAYPFLLWSLEDAVSGESVECDPLKYRYFRMVLEELERWSSSEGALRRRHSTADLDLDVDGWCGSKLSSRRRERVQVLNGSAFVLRSNLERVRSGSDGEGYSASVLLYVGWLVERYGAAVADTDFVWHFHDVKLGQTLSARQFLWALNDSIPYFFTDAEVTWKRNRNAAHILFGASRNFMKYRHFAERAYSDWKRFGQRLRRKGDRLRGSALSFANLQRIGDYLEYKEWLNANGPGPTRWDRKGINRALFVGGMAGEIRPKFFELMVNDSFVGNLTAGYLDAVWRTAASPENERVSISEQMDYRFLVVLDGNSVRDGMLYQMDFDAVMLKQRSPIYEFWHFDLEHGRDLLLFENVLHLIAVVTNLVDQVHGYYAESGRRFGEKNRPQFAYFGRDDVPQRSPFNVHALRRIASNARRFVAEFLNQRSVDCFMLNMLRLYNHFLFDTESLRPSQAQCPMTELVLDDLFLTPHPG